MKAPVFLVPLVLAAVALAPSFPAPGSPMDEGLLLVLPDQVRAGRVVYRDFLHPYGPGGPYLLAGVYAVAGSGVAAERAAGLLVRLGIVALLVAFGRRRSAAAGLGAGLAGAAVLVKLGLPALDWLFAAALLLSALVRLDGRGGAGLAGFAAAASLLFRPDLGPAAILAPLPPLLRRDRGERRRYLMGAAVGLLPWAAVLLAAGPSAVFESAFLDPVVRGAGRRLPVPPETARGLTLFVLVLAAAAAVLAAGIRRRGGLLSAGILAVLGLPVMFHRADGVHMAYAGIAALGLLPAAIAGWGFRRRGVAAAVAGALVLAAGWETLFWPAAREVLRGTGLRAGRPGVEVEEEGRRWPVATEEEARAVRALLAATRAAVPAGGRIVVGPADLSRAVYADAFLYWLLPDRPPGTRHLYMAPGSTDRAGSGFAGDVAGADAVITNGAWDGWKDPLVRPGDPAAADALREGFREAGRYGSYRLWLPVRSPR